MAPSIRVILFALLYIWISVGCAEEEVTKETQKEGLEEPIKETVKEGLTRLNGYKVGHEQVIDVGRGQQVKLITRSMRPLLFEINDFVSSEEIDNIIRRAKDPAEGGMFASIAKGGLTFIDKYTPLGISGKANTSFGDFRLWDQNGDGKIVMAEAIRAIHMFRSMYMKEDEIQQMFKKLNITEMDDGDITAEEFEHMDTIGVQDYVNMQYRENPKHMERHSEQAWLHMEQWIDPVIHNIRERVVRITGLDRKIVYGGERLQVLRYGPHGHYNGHYDSETHTRQDIPCCHQFTAGDAVKSIGKCKLCRYITFLMYLNNVEEGGETGFPAADNGTYSHINMRVMGDADNDLFNLHQNCKKGNLVVPAKKGTAVMWYNHLRDEKTGWMGALDEFSIHGGCAVTKGEKWVANMWLPAPYEKDKDIPSIYLNVLDYKIAEENAKNLEAEEALRKDAERNANEKEQVGKSSEDKKEQVSKSSEDVKEEL